LSRFEVAPEKDESRALVDIKSSYGLFTTAPPPRDQTASRFQTASARRGEVLAEVAEAGPADVGPRGEGCPEGYEIGLGPDGRAATGRSYLYRIARLNQGAVA